MNTKTFSRRYWRSLTSSRPIVSNNPRNRVGYSFWQRYWASLLGIQMPAKPRTEFEVESEGRSKSAHAKKCTEETSDPRSTVGPFSDWVLNTATVGSVATGAILLSFAVALFIVLILTSNFSALAWVSIIAIGIPIAIRVVYMPTTKSMESRGDRIRAMKAIRALFKSRQKKGPNDRE